MAKVLNIGKSEFFSLAEAVSGTGEMMLTATDAIKWLKKDTRRLSLFFEIERAGFLKGPVDQDILLQLVDCGLVKNDEHGNRLSEQGRLTVEAFEALRFLDKIA